MKYQHSLLNIMILENLRKDNAKGSSLNFSAHGWWGKEKKLAAAKNPVRPRKNTAEGGCGGNSAIPLQKIEASPAALLVQSRTQQKSFLFLLEEKIRRAQNQKCRENFFAGWRVPASGGGLASLVWFCSGVSDKMSSSQTVKTHQNLTFGKLTDFFVGGAKRRPSISPRQILSARRGEPRLAVGQDEVRLPRDLILSRIYFAQ